jgi:neurobeachin-like protein 1/2
VCRYYVCVCVGIEFYYNAEFLRNRNELDLGQMQAGAIVDNVVLPPWANGSAEEFIRLHSLALESDYVSNNLHHWIDLIFGYKQRGKAAIEAQNVFYYLTYEGAVDLAKITDAVLRKATETQIASFGQCPSQLLTKPHPARAPRQPVLAFTSETLQMYSLSSSKIHEQLSAAFRVVHSVVLKSSFETGEWIPTQIMVQDEKFIVWTSDGQYKSFRWSITPPSSSSSSGNSVGGVSCSVTPSQASSTSLGTYCSSLPSSCHDRFVSILPQKLFFSSGHWDYTFRVAYLYNATSPLYRVTAHKDRVTCLAYELETLTLVSGSLDCTVMVWNLGDAETAKRQSSSDRVLELSELQQAHCILRGHDAGITCVAFSSDFDVVVSGAACGTVLLHTLRLGKYVRALQRSPAAATRVYSADLVVLGKVVPHIVVYSRQSASLLLYNINGHLLHEQAVEPDEVINDMIINNDGSFLISGGGASITVRLVHNLQVVFRMEVGPEVSCVTISHDDRVLFIGLSAGIVLMCTTCLPASHH